MSILFDPYELYIPRHTSLALSISLIVHASLFAIGWSLVKVKTPQFIEPKLSIVLVSRKTLHAPKRIRAYAQADLDGGGNPNQEGHSARTTSANLPNQSEHTELLENALVSQESAASQSTKTAPPNESTPYLTRKGSTTLTLHSQDVSHETEPSPALSTTSAALLPNIPNIAGKLSYKIDTAQDDQHSKVLGANTREYRYAGYYEGILKKVERIGTAYYHATPKNKNLLINKTAYITLSVRSDGHLISAKIKTSSGDPKVDKMMIDIAYQASPYTPFPDSLRTETSKITFTKLWKFNHFNQLSGDE